MMDDAGPAASFEAPSAARLDALADAAVRDIVGCLHQAGSEDVEPEDVASAAWVEWQEVGPGVWAPPG